MNKAELDRRIELALVWRPQLEEAYYVYKKAKQDLDVCGRDEDAELNEVAGEVRKRIYDWLRKSVDVEVKVEFVTRYGDRPLRRFLYCQVAMRVKAPYRLWTVYGGAAVLRLRTEFRAVTLGRVRQEVVALRSMARELEDHNETE